MDRYLTLGIVRITEMAALYASRYMGRGDETQAYASASNAMRQTLASIHGDINIVIGGDDAELASGTRITTASEPKIDVALKPLDGKTTCARGGHNAAAVTAVGDAGAFMPTDPGLMTKIAVGPDLKGIIDIDLPPSVNIKRVARARKKYIEDVTVCVLDREYNMQTVDYVRETGARIVFIRGGDISGVVSAAMPDNQIDLFIGTGGRREGVLAAAALKCIGGDMQARYVYQADDEHSNAMANVDYNKIYTISDLVPGTETVVAITGVTDGVLLKGVRYVSGGAETSSVVFRQKTHTIRQIQAIHRFDSKPGF